MRRAVCPGSFDPLHLGHVEVISRAARLVDEVIVAVSVNPAKTYRFSMDERIALIESVFATEAAVRVLPLGHGLIADFCREVDAEALVKGLRGGADFEYEAPMATMNRHLTGVETLFVAADPRYAQISSSLVKEVASHGGDVSAFVPSAVARALSGRAGSDVVSDV